MGTRQMNCPGCGEEIYEEELIDGDCPLCGETVRSDSETSPARPHPTEPGADPETGADIPDEAEETLERIVGFFETETDSLSLGPADKTTNRTRRFVLEVPPSVVDKLRPKRCDACGRWHLKIGCKEYDIILEGNTGEMEINYYCVLCEPDPDPDPDPDLEDK